MNKPVKYNRNRFIGHLHGYNGYPSIAVYLLVYQVINGSRRTKMELHE